LQKEKAEKDRLAAVKAAEKEKVQAEKEEHKKKVAEKKAGQDERRKLKEEMKKCKKRHPKRRLVLLAARAATGLCLVNVRPSSGVSIAAAFRERSPPTSRTADLKCFFANGEWKFRKKKFAAKFVFFCFFLC